MLLESFSAIRFKIGVIFMKKIRRVVISDFFDSLSIGAFTTYAYWYIYETTKNQSLVSILGTISMAAMLLSFIGGYIVDQQSKVKLLRAIILIRCLLVVIGLSLLYLFHSNLKTLFLVVIANSLLSIVYTPLSESIAPVLVENKKELFKANSWVSLANQLASVSSSGLSVLFVLWKKPIWALFGLGLSVLISYLTILHVPSDATPIQEHSLSFGKTMSDFKHGLLLIVHNRLISLMIPIALISNFCFWSIWLLMPKYSVDIFNQYKIVYNIIDISFTIGGILGAAAFSKYHGRLKTGVFYPTLLVGQSMMLILLGINAWVRPSIINVFFVSILWIGYGIFNSISSVIYFSIIQMSANNDTIGLIIGAVLTIFSLANPIAAALSAPISRLYTLPTIIVIFGSIMLFAALAVFSPYFNKELAKYDKNYN